MMNRLPALPSRSVRRKAYIWALRLVGSTNMFGQTRAINSCLLTSSPGRSHDAHRQWMEPALCARFGGLHENILHRRHGRAMPLWQERIFAAMMRNAFENFILPRALHYSRVCHAVGVMKGSGLYTSARQCLLLAQSGHPDALDQCPLWG